MKHANLPQVQYVEDLFVYEQDFSSLAANGSATANVAVQADSDFKLMKMTYMADIAGGAVTDDARIIPLVTVQITDTGSGRALFSTPIPIPNIFGTGEIPFILPVARIFKARSNITVAVANYSAGTTYNLRLSLIGTKVFKLG